MATDTEGQRKAHERGWVGAAAVEFAKHWDAGGDEAVRQNRALIAAAFHGTRAAVAAVQPTLPKPATVYERRAAAVAAARGEAQPRSHVVHNAVAHPEQVYAQRAQKVTG